MYNRSKTYAITENCISTNCMLVFTSVKHIMRITIISLDTERFVTKHAVISGNPTGSYLTSVAFPKPDNSYLTFSRRKRFLISLTKQRKKSQSNLFTTNELTLTSRLLWKWSDGHQIVVVSCFVLDGNHTQ